MIVDGCVLVEVMAVEVIAPSHVQEVYTFLRPGNDPVGRLLNFGPATMRGALKRIVNGYPGQQSGLAKVGRFSRA